MDNIVKSIEEYVRYALNLKSEDKVTITSREEDNNLIFNIRVVPVEYVFDLDLDVVD